MAIRSVRQPKSQLPRARFYLDDIEEFQSIISEAYEKYEGPPKILFSYLVEGKLEVSTVSELAALGGSTELFELRARINFPEDSELDYLRSSDDHVVFRLGRYGSAMFSVPRTLADREFELCAKADAIASDRADKLIRFAQDYGFLVRALGFASFAVGLYFALIGVMDKLVHPIRDELVALSSLALCALIIALGSADSWRHDTVIFERYRPTTLGRKARLRERLEKGLWLIFGTVLGAIVTWLFSRASGKP